MSTNRRGFLKRLTGAGAAAALATVPVAIAAPTPERGGTVKATVDALMAYYASLSPDTLAVPKAIEVPFATMPYNVFVRTEAPGCPALNSIARALATRAPAQQADAIKELHAVAQELATRVLGTARPTFSQAYPDLQPARIVTPRFVFDLDAVAAFGLDPLTARLAFVLHGVYDMVAELSAIHGRIVEAGGETFFHERLPVEIEMKKEAYMFEAFWSLIHRSGAI